MDWQSMISHAGFWILIQVVTVANPDGLNILVYFLHVVCDIEQLITCLLYVLEVHDAIDR